MPAAKIALLLNGANYDASDLWCPLQDTPKDASSFGSRLRSHGFCIVQQGNGRGTEIRVSARKAAEHVDMDTEVVVLYWSGHVRQNICRTMLVPTDAVMPDGSDSVSLVELLEILCKTAGPSALFVVIIDCCQDFDGFETEGPLPSDQNFIILFACKPKHNAVESRFLSNGFLTRAFLQFGFENCSFYEMFGKIQERVLSETRGAQKPWILPVCEEVAQNLRINPFTLQLLHVEGMPFERLEDHLHQHSATLSQQSVLQEDRAEQFQPEFDRDDKLYDHGQHPAELNQQTFLQEERAGQFQAESDRDDRLDNISQHPAEVNQQPLLQEERAGQFQIGVDRNDTLDHLSRHPSAPNHQSFLQEKVGQFQTDFDGDDRLDHFCQDPIELNQQPLLQKERAGQLQSEFDRDDTLDHLPQHPNTLNQQFVLQDEHSGKFQSEFDRDDRLDHLSQHLAEVNQQSCLQEERAGQFQFGLNISGKFDVNGDIRRERGTIQPEDSESYEPHPFGVQLLDRERGNIRRVGNGQTKIPELQKLKQLFEVERERDSIQQTQFSKTVELMAQRHSILQQTQSSHKLLENPWGQDTLSGCRETAHDVDQQERLENESTSAEVRWSVQSELAEARGRLAELQLQLDMNGDHTRSVCREPEPEQHNQLVADLQGQVGRALEEANDLKTALTNREVHNSALQVELNEARQKFAESQLQLKFRHANGNDNQYGMRAQSQQTMQVKSQSPVGNDLEDLGKHRLRLTQLQNQRQELASLIDAKQADLVQARHDLEDAERFCNELHVQLLKEVDNRDDVERTLREGDQWRRDASSRCKELRQQLVPLEMQSIQKEEECLQEQRKIDELRKSLPRNEEAPSSSIPSLQNANGSAAVGNADTKQGLREKVTYMRQDLREMWHAQEALRSSLSALTKTMEERRKNADTSDRRA